MKKAVIKRAFIVMMAGVMASSMLACRKDEVATQQNAYDEVVKPKSISMMVDTTFLEAENGRDDFIQKFKEITGIELKVTQPVHNQYYEKVNLAFASGDIPELVEMSGTNFLNYASNGALYDMTKLVENSEMVKNIDKKYFDSIKVNDKIYMVPNTTGGGTVTYARGDWMEANNIKAPTNYTEFINMLKVFADDPDKNGKKDTIGLTVVGFINSATPFDIYLKEFYQDASPDFIKVNGKWVDGMLQPELKQALQRLRDAYALGVIDTEAVTNKTSTCRDKYYAGKVGAFNYWAGTWNVRLDDELQRTVPSGKSVPLPAIKECKYVERLPGGLVITNKAQNPEGIFKYFLEYIHDGKEGQLLFTHGVKGLNYEIKDGKYVKLPSKQDPSTPFIKSYFDPAFSLTKWNDPFESNPRVTNSVKILNDNSVIPTILPASEVYNREAADILVSRTEVISKAVMGQMTIDEAINQYIKQSKATSDAILKELNAAK